MYADHSRRDGVAVGRRSIARRSEPPPMALRPLGEVAGPAGHTMTTNIGLRIEGAETPLTGCRARRSNRLTHTDSDGPGRADAPPAT
jgi:hypothetical protein